MMMYVDWFRGMDMSGNGCGCAVGRRAYELYLEDVAGRTEAGESPLSLPEFLGNESVKAPYREKARAELGASPCGPS